MNAACLRQPARRIRSAPLHRHDTASLGARTIGLTGTGSEHARLLRLVLLSYTRWPGRTGQSPWPSNATLAARTGLDERQVERALAALVAADLVSTRIGRRHGARREVGRVIDVGLHSQVKALAPDGVDVRTLWDVARSLRDRPAALVTAMVGAYMLASDAAGGAIDEWSALGCTMADWRRFVGHRDNASWSARVRDLEALGLIRREGRMVYVSPPRAWLGLAVAGRKVAAVKPAAAPVADVRVLIPVRMPTIAPLRVAAARPDLAAPDRWLRVEQIASTVVRRTGTGPP